MNRPTVHRCVAAVLGLLACALCRSSLAEPITLEIHGPISAQLPDGLEKVRVSVGAQLRTRVHHPEHGWCRALFLNKGRLSTERGQPKFQYGLLGGALKAGSGQRPRNALGWFFSRVGRMERTLLEQAGIRRAQYEGNIPGKERKFADMRIRDVPVDSLAPLLERLLSKTNVHRLPRPLAWSNARWQLAREIREELGPEEMGQVNRLAHLDIPAFDGDPIKHLRMRFAGVITQPVEPSSVADGRASIRPQLTFDGVASGPLRRWIVDHATVLEPADLARPGSTRPRAVDTPFLLVPERLVPQLKAHANQTAGEDIPLNLDSPLEGIKASVAGLVRSL